MSRRWPIFLLLAAVLVAAWASWRWTTSADPDSVQASVVGITPPDPDFSRVEAPMELVFPRDHGAHPEYQTEWWYYTGNLQTESGRRFGYQLTFFRRALLSPNNLPTRASDWASGQIYLAHLALTDAANKDFTSYERYMRGGAGLAGAIGEPTYQVWLEDWRVEQTGWDEYVLSAAEGDIALDLVLRDAKGPVLQGEQGFSRKGPQAGNASTYYSQSRLISEGTVTVAGENFAVQGTSWMDHEFSTSALSEGQTGWDWFALQLSDGSELMVFYIRREDGTIDPFSSGTWIAADGSTRPLTPKDFAIATTASWTSPHSGGEYPAGWRIEVPSVGLSIEVEPVIADQEHQLAFIYWEGAVDVTGTAQGQPVTGVGYVELTGYVGSLAGQF